MSDKTELIRSRVDLLVAPPMVDEAMIDEACEHITALLHKTLFKGLTAVGGYILERFFRGDAKAAASRHPLKNASYRALAERCETAALPVSRSWLNGAVNLALRDHELRGESDAWDRLSPTHKLRLLPMQDSKKLLRLAETAVRRDLTTRDLQQLVNKELAKQPRDPRGRRPTNIVVKTLDRATKIFSTPEGARRAFKKSEISALGSEQAREALKAARQLIAQLAELGKQLEERLE